jgi:hypothetical protein
MKLTNNTRDTVERRFAYLSPTRYVERERKQLGALARIAPKKARKTTTPEKLR